MSSIDRTADAEQTSSASPIAQASTAQTVVGLFDDQIDAEHALADLRKHVQPAASISVLARDRRIRDEQADSPIDVTRAVVDTALSAVTGWLSGLASLVIPNQGHFLAAGPIGVVLARLRPDPERGENGEPAARPVAQPVGSVGLALERFGFRPEEAHYLEQRLAAGSTMIAVTAEEQAQVDATLRAFGDDNAVFIGQAETPGDVLAEANQGLAAPLSASAAEVIVADIVAPLRHVCRGSGDETELTRLCGIDVFDEQGARLGEVDEILVEEADDALVRYIVVGHGGLLGIARRRFAIPAAIVQISERPLRIALGGRNVGDLESFEPHEPFSRKNESAVFQFFGLPPYWES